MRANFWNKKDFVMYGHDLIEFYGKEGRTISNGIKIRLLIQL